MSIFKSSSSLDKQTRRVDNETISSIIDQNMIITGDLSFQWKTRIDGTVNGDIKGEHLILSQSGSIKGDLEVVTFVCHGTIDGSVSAGMVTARKGCMIRGKVAAENLIVEPGASLDGEVKTAGSADVETGKDESIS
jgi:cytoskeletal protein CcmA (bactofilin family)